MSFRKAVFLITVLLVSSLALAQGTYTQIDPPGSVNTQALGIDSAGDIVGWYEVELGNPNGFLLSSGTYTTINIHGKATALSGINDLSQVVGISARTGFLYNLQTRQFTAIEDPITHNTSLPMCINNAGTIGGYYVYHIVENGFELTGGTTYTRIKPPHFRADITSVTGVSSAGKLVGYADTLSYSYSQGVYKRLLIPEAPGAIVFGINPAGNALVGSYSLSPTVAAGFVYQNQVLTTLQFPGSTQTYANGINSAGEVVGYFSDGGGVSHGFTWTPPAAAGKK